MSVSFLRSFAELTAKNVMTFHVTSRLRVHTADRPSLALAERLIEAILKCVVLLKMAKAGTVTKGGNSVGLGYGSKAAGTRAVFTNTALVVIDIRDFHPFTAYIYRISIVFVDRAERTHVGTLAASVANMSVIKWSLLYLSIGYYHMESLT